MLHTTFLFNLNYGPFGSGTWFQEKREMLNLFLEHESLDSPIFQKYAEMIAGDLRLPSGTREELHAVWDALAGLNLSCGKVPW